MPSNSDTSPIFNSFSPTAYLLLVCLVRSTMLPRPSGGPDLTSRACDLHKRGPENSGDAQRRGTFVMPAQRLEAPCATRIRPPPAPRSAPSAPLLTGSAEMGHVARRVNAGGSVVYQGVARGPDGKEHTRAFVRKLDAQRWVTVQD